MGNTQLYEGEYLASELNSSVHESSKCTPSRPWQPLDSINYNISVGVFVRDCDGRRFVCIKRKGPERLKMIVRIRRGLLIDHDGFRAI